MINVGPENLLWGWLQTTLGTARSSDRPYQELELGYTPGVLLVWVGMSTWLAWKQRRTPDRIDDLERALLALGLTLVVTFILQLGIWRVWLWRLVYWAVPGASGVRTTFRMQLVQNLAACMLITFAIERMRAWFAGRSSYIAVIVGVLLLEQINLGAPISFSARAQLVWLANIPPQPKGCEVFYLVPRATPDPGIWYVHQSDAMLVWAFRKLPTLNGNSSVWPHGWNLKDPASEGYLQNVRSWISANTVKQALCALDPRTGKWSPDLLDLAAKQ
jgi:hypothetical protein